MAKKKNAMEQLPEGFEPVSGRLDGFFLVEEGNQVQGVLRDSFIVHGKFGDKRVYKIEVDAVGTRAVNADEGEFDVEVGQTIGLDEKGYLKKLADIEQGSRIFVRCVGKEEKARVKGQNPAWKFIIGKSEGTIPF